MLAFATSKGGLYTMSLDELNAAFGKPVPALLSKKLQPVKALGWGLNAHKLYGATSSSIIVLSQS